MPERPQYLIDDENTHALLPDADEVLGHEGTDVAVLVHTDGPVRVEQLPKHMGTCKTYTVDTTATRILLGDPRRARAVIMSIDQSIWFGANQNECDSSYGGFWFLGVPLIIENQDEMWFRSNTATTRITVVTEMWSR